MERMRRESATYTCLNCRARIRVLADEYGDHPCGNCGWEPWEDDEKGADKMSIIETLRKFDGTEGDTRDEEYEEIDVVLDAYKPKGYSVKTVDSEFEDGGRWTNTKSEVYEVTEGDNTAYFRLWREVPATEMQEGGDFSFGFDEVRPQEVTVIKYV